MVRDESGLTKIKSVFGNLVSDPIDTIDIFSRDKMPKGPDGKKLRPVTSGFTTGLSDDDRIMMAHKIGKVNDKDKSPNKVLHYLDTIDNNRYVDEYYDCEDRALWVMAHVRNRFVGEPIAVGSGKTKLGEGDPHPGEDHARIILWYIEDGKLEHLYWEPEPKQNGRPFGVVGELGQVKSIIAFPISPIGHKSDLSPFKELDYDPLNGQIIIFDSRRMIYKLRENSPRLGILDYLNNKIWENSCVELLSGVGHDKVALSKQNEDLGMWRDYDRALWAFVHTRRIFPGCPVGVAIGEPAQGEGGGSSYSVVLIFYYDDEDDIEHANLKYTYWDPRDEREIKNFDPKMAFM